MYSQIVLSVAAIVAYVLVSRLIERLLNRIGERKRAAPKRARYIAKVFEMLVVVVLLAFLSVIWGIDFRTVIVAASSILAVMGIAFFAQWSILSNVTASIVIFFSYPARIGDKVRIMDVEGMRIEGTIVDINLFQVLIRDDDGNLINYPNNLLIQKPLVKVKSATSPPTGPLPAEDATG